MDVSPLHWTFRPQDVSPLTVVISPVSGLFAPACKL